MLPLAAIAVGALIGFVGSRKLRRPQHAAQAASVARSVSGSVGGRRTLTPPELQRACFSEMVRHVRVSRDGKTVAPARYLLQLDATDMAVVDDTKAWFVDGLRDALTDAAASNGWTVDGPIDIRFEVDPSRRPGVPNAMAVDPGGPKKAPARGTTATGVALVRDDTEERWPLDAHTVSIGRGSASTIVVDDTRVSRLHAKVAPGRSGWTVTDAGSSNGTTHNGRLLTPNVPQPLKPGDRIGIGPVEFLVKADGGPSEAGTRALDDRERTRISGEVLPPPRRPRS